MGIPEEKVVCLEGQRQVAAMALRAVRGRYIAGYKYKIQNKTKKLVVWQWRVIRRWPGSAVGPEQHPLILSYSPEEFGVVVHSASGSGLREVKRRMPPVCLDEIVVIARHSSHAVMRIGRWRRWRWWWWWWW